MGIDEKAVIAATEAWLLKAVIGLNLCPFAAPVHKAGRIRFAISQAATPEALLEDLAVELRLLADADPGGIETTLLIHPQVLGDFLDFNDFLDVTDAVIDELGLEGVLQVASFHPDYQFAETETDDIGNFTNRAPFPTLHLLREDSIARAVEAYPDTDSIYRRNIETLRRLGREGWDKLGVGAPAAKKG